MSDYDKYMAKMRRISALIPTIKKLISVMAVFILAVTILGIATLLKIGSFTAPVSCDDIIYGETLTYSATAYKSSITYYFAESGNEEWSELSPYKVGNYTVKAVSNALFTTKESTCDFKIEKRDLIVIFNPVDVMQGTEPVPDISFHNLAKDDTAHLKGKVEYILPEAVGEGIFKKLDSNNLYITNSKSEDVTDCYNIISEDGKFNVTENPNHDKDDSKNDSSDKYSSGEDNSDDVSDDTYEDSYGQETDFEENEETSSSEDTVSSSYGNESDGSDEPEALSGFGGRPIPSGEKNAQSDSKDSNEYQKNSLAFSDNSAYDAAELFDSNISKSSPLSETSSGILFSVKSEKAGQFLLKSKTYDSYNAKGTWNNTIDLGKSERKYWNPWTWVGSLLSRNGKDVYKISIKENGFQNISTLLPYYTSYGASSQSDVSMYYGNSTFYNETFDFPVANADIDEILSYRDQIEYGTGEYRDLVYRYYLDISPNSSTLFSSLAKENGIAPDSETVINDVAEYIMNSATYNMNFTKYPSDVDPSIYFITQAHEGICQHFASAATLMYRALGIPARYTVGYSVYCNDEWYGVTEDNAHAWVEVYVDTIGWIAVDPTPSPSGDDHYHATERGKITIKMADTSMIFTGHPMASNNCYLESGGLIPGDTLYCKGSALETYAGIYKNNCIDYYIQDIYGNDVTEEYEITTKPGTLNITPIYLSYNGEIELVEKIDRLQLSSIKWNESSYNYIPRVKNFHSKHYEITDDNVLFGKSAMTGWITFIYDNVDLNDDGIYEISESESFCKLKIRSFSNVNIMQQLRSANASFTADLTEKEDYTGRKYNHIVVEMDSAQKDFDDTPLCVDSATIIGGCLYPGDKIVSYSNSRLKYVGSTTNKCFDIRVLDASGNDVTKNYYIDVYDGTLTINTSNSTFNNECTMKMWTSLKTDSLFDSFNLDVYNWTVDILESDNNIALKNEAISAVSPGNASIHGTNSIDIDGDGVMEYTYDAYVYIQVTIPILFWIVCSFGLFLALLLFIKNRTST